MDIEEFENRLQEIRSQNGWRIEIEVGLVFIVSVYDKDTNEFLGETGTARLSGILKVLEIPISDESMWIHRKV